MSKFNLKVSYKECCILKHGLEHSIENKKEIKCVLNAICINTGMQNAKKEYEKYSKDIKEEELLYKKLCDFIESNKSW